jgi:succinate dehydrogenase/fumarate reductase cytochrome b subunit
MSTRNLNYYLMKTARLSGWLLFFLVLGYILTGFALCGKVGFGELIDLETALVLHKFFDWPLVAIFALHSVITIYFALRRWGWIQNKKSPQRSEKLAPEQPQARVAPPPPAAVAQPPHAVKS